MLAQGGDVLLEAPQTVAGDTTQTGIEILEAGVLWKLERCALAKLLQKHDEQI